VPKTTPPGKVELDHGTFEARVVPDVFDARDLEYRSRKGRRMGSLDAPKLTQLGDVLTRQHAIGRVQARPARGRAAFTLSRPRPRPSAPVLATWPASSDPLLITQIDALLDLLSGGL
jgi:hypothetical protein